MNRTPISSWQRINPFAYVGRLCAWLSRLLLILTAIEFVTMPLTQHLWTWDHFLRGGQDFESSLLIIVISLCLVLVLAHHCQRGVDWLLALQRLFLPIFPDNRLCAMPPAGALTAFVRERMSSPVLDIYNLPLQI